MSVKINLLKGGKQKSIHKIVPVNKKRIINSSVLLFLLILVALSVVSAYKLILQKQVEVLASNIKRQEEIIALYKDVEEKKSILTLKTNEIQDIYHSKFDYLKAINDAQELFGYSLYVESISLENDGFVSIIAKKVSEITLSKEQAFSTNIQELQLSIIVPNSLELEYTIDTLLGFEGQGLSSVVANSTSLTEDGDYQVDFTITFDSKISVETNEPVSDDIDQ